MECDLLPRQILSESAYVEGVTAYYALRPDATVPRQRVLFVTSGHRGSAFDTAFNESHVAAISQAICDYRAHQEIHGPLFLGIDTHALSVPAFTTTLEMLAANEVQTMIAAKDEYTPTPAISHAIPEDVYKIYAESFRGADHLALVLGEAQAIVDDALRAVAD